MDRKGLIERLRNGGYRIHDCPALDSYSDTSVMKMAADMLEQDEIQLASDRQIIEGLRANVMLAKEACERG